MLIWMSLLATAHGDWRLVSQTKPIPLGRGAWEVTKRLENSSDSAELKLVFFDSSRCTFRVLDQNSSGNRSIGEAMRKSGALAGCNGGYFSPDFRPVGLQISNGNRTGRLERSSPLLTGSVVVKKGRSYLLWRDEFQNVDGISDAIQAGPRIVIDNSRVKGLENAKSRPRTFVVTDNRGHLGIGTCRSVTLAELSEILASSRIIREMKVDRALNLDGGGSSGFWWRDDRNTEHYDRERVTVRNFLAVMTR